MLPALLKSIPGDVRGAVVGIGVTFLGSCIYGYYWPQEPSTYAIPVNVDGYAKPLPGLLRNAARENPSSTYRTEPENLAAAWVCEAASIRGEDAHQLLMQYLDLYKACFSLDQKSKRAFVIRPNKHSGNMMNDERGWFCKCDNTIGGQPKG